MKIMEEHALVLEREVGERTQELADEKKRTELMLYRMLPKSPFSLSLKYLILQQLR